MRTIREMDEAGHDLMVWCYACARGARVDGEIWRRFAARGWDDALPAARRRFRCQLCRGHDVLIVPAGKGRQYRRPPSKEQWTATDLVAAYFHSMRSAAKRRKREERD